MGVNIKVERRIGQLDPPGLSDRYDNARLLAHKMIFRSSDGRLPWTPGTTPDRSLDVRLPRQ